MLSIQKAKKFTITLLTIIAILTWTAVWYTETQGRILKVTFFDIGQGDSIFIETPGKHQILIDGGPSAAVLAKLGRNMPFYDHSLDLIILTHPDADHLNGLVEVLERYSVDLILWTGVEHQTAAYKRFKDLISQKQIQTKIAQAGQIIKLGKLTMLYILWPEKNLNGIKPSNSNAASIIAQLVYNESEFLFTGDAESDVEKKLISAMEMGDISSLESDVLKISHHGSKYATSLNFLKVVQPKAGVISCGLENRYKHPAKNVLQNLQSNKVNIFRTDFMGDITMISNGEKIKVETEK